MPGILPMKVIRVGTSAQARIAQACDRCRSKKIRCDGFRPTCTQCSTVGFECKTSDKLSRRAFPRGYTESLEERVRSLEGEVKELKDLLDDKDEKIEMLSKMYSHSPRGQCSSSRRPSSTSSAMEKLKIKETTEDDDAVYFQPPQLLSLLENSHGDSLFVGRSSNSAYFAYFTKKMQDCGRQVDGLAAEGLFNDACSPNPTSSIISWTRPSRLFSDQMVNIYFQEWAPLFPILHRPTFLGLYEQYTTSDVTDEKSWAQLNLIFGIASLSTNCQKSSDADLCEGEWSAALNMFINQSSVATLQCLLLAQIYCVQAGQLQKALHYKGIAVTMTHQLGMHLSQKQFGLGVLSTETRKKVFWSLYTLDSFTAALSGLPRLLADDDIECEYPVNADDEYVTECGFQPSLPGEYTKISSALSLFRACRIMGRVLDQNYTQSTSNELALSDIAALDAELEDWWNSQPPHLKMHFAQDKPSTKIISSRSPLLSLTHDFIRTLIHRPVVCADLGDSASTSAITLATTLKQTIQVIQLLDERSLSFSFCLNKHDLLTSSVLGLLHHSLDLESDSRMYKDFLRLSVAVINMLAKDEALSSQPLKRLLNTVAKTPLATQNLPMAENLPLEMSRAQRPCSVDGGSHKQLTALAARYSAVSGHPATAPRDGSKEGIKRSQKTARRNSTNFRLLAPSLPSRRPTSHSDEQNDQIPTEEGEVAPRQSRPRSTNLDYYAFSNDTTDANNLHSLSEDMNLWERVLSTLDGNPNMQDSVHEHQYDVALGIGSPDSTCDWPRIDPLSNLSPSVEHDLWSSDMWAYDEAHSTYPSQSVLSVSDDSLASGEDLSSVEMCSTESERAPRKIKASRTVKGGAK